MRRAVTLLAGLLLAAPIAISTAHAASPTVHTEDVYRFYKVYDAAHGHPTAAALQHDYLDPGSPGLHRLAKLRRVTGKRIAATLARDPKIYAHARRCMAVLPRVRTRLDAALAKLRRLYPEAQFPPVTIAVSRGKPVAATDAKGVMVGLEALCAVTWLEPDLENRFVHVIAHEYAHVQQAHAAPKLYTDDKPTVLEESLIEGAAEFTGELISGSVAYVYLGKVTKGHETEIETRFAADENKTDLSAWLGNGTLTKPGDLGYWVGYRIVKSYYQHHTDKTKALRAILGMSDPRAFLAASGWYPGIKLD